MLCSTRIPSSLCVHRSRTLTRRPASAVGERQAASQLMHAEAEAGTDGRDSSGRPYNPGYQRKTWSAEEDAAIHSLIAQHGTRWRAIAPHLAGRSDDSVRNRCVAAAATPQEGG